MFDFMTQTESFLYRLYIRIANLPYKNVPIFVFEKYEGFERW